MRTGAVALALLLLAACARDPKHAVLGEWQSGGERMEFLGDGRADYRVAATRDSLVLCRAAAPAECYRFSRVRAGRR